jgi:hypothetical protein
MTPPLEIFKLDYSGDIRWLEPAKDIEAAKSRLKALGMVKPGRYVLFSQKTGNRLIFQINEDGKLLEVSDSESKV